jgi:hypothetical protein
MEKIRLDRCRSRHGETGKQWRGIDPTAKGRHWFVPPAELDKLDAAGKIHWPAKKGGVPMLKRHVDEQRGVPLQDVWTDLPPLHNLAAERLGYPTQKPESLLERIIQASTSEGNTVLDPFCGCGTTIAAAQKLGRNWIGIDITHLAINLIKNRLLGSFGPAVKASYHVVGEPVSFPDAARLAEEDPYQFQWWALGLVGARPVEQKKGADKGVDGRLYFHDEGLGGKTKQIVFSVKAGGVGVPHVRDLPGVLDREKAQIGVLISLEEPTRPMRTEAASAGFYSSPWGTQHPRMQLRTIAELLDSKGIDYPPSKANVTFKRAPKVATPEIEQIPLLSEVAEEAAPYIVKKKNQKGSASSRPGRGRHRR